MTLLEHPKLMTTEDLDALPDDGTERWLINGELREREMTRRSLSHSEIEANFSGELYVWRKTQPRPHGKVLSGEAGVRLRRNPDTTVGVDVAYISAETARDNPHGSRMVDGIPLLVIEVLSPSDKQEDTDEKVRTYLACGVPDVWVANTNFRTVAAYRPDAEPQMFSVSQTISAEPHLPGLRIPLANIFQD